MLIEKDAKSRIVKAIELEKEIQNFEISERLKGKVVLGCETYDELRKKFVLLCGNLNSVANFEGKGRDDLTIEILMAAERISRRISNAQSRAVRKLAEQIKNSFTDIRILMRKYRSNLDGIDPQLKNNQDLVDVLMKFEHTWEKGKDFLLNKEICDMLIEFSQLVEGISEKYKDIEERIENIDADIFVIMPCIVVLNSLEGNDKGICEHYYLKGKNNDNDREEFKLLKEKYKRMKKKCKDEYELYNIIEREILDKGITKQNLKKIHIRMDEVKTLVHDIKKIGIKLQRTKPSEWNSLMETAMGQI